MLAIHTFNTGELTLSYAEGPDNGPPLVLLHGATARWQTLEPLIQVFGEHWHVYALDLRGHGESGRAPEHGAYLVRDYVRDISAFIREEVPYGEQVVLVGFSLGAMIALGAAASLRERARGLVLVEPPLMLRNHRFRELPIAELLTLAYEATRKRPPFEELLTISRSVMPEADEVIVMAVATQLSKIDPEVTNPAVLDRGLEDVDLRTLLEAVTCPILLFHGEQELGALVQDDDAAWAREHAQDLEVVTVPGAGHDIPMGVVVEHGMRFLETLVVS